MNQSGIVHPSLLASIAAMFPETVTVQAATDGQGTYGEATTTYGNVTGLTNLKAAVAPVLGVDERTGNPRTTTIGDYEVGLQGYYPAITTKHRLTLWSRPFGIIAVHQSPHTVMTRLTVREVV